MAHPCPPALDPNPSAPQPKPSHWESPPILGLGTRVATLAWHVLSITRISTSKLNTHERPHTYKPRPYLTGPTHLPQPWRSGEKQRKRLLSTRARQPPPRNSAAPEIPSPARPRAGGQRTPNEDQGSSWPAPGARMVFQRQPKRGPNGKARTRGSCGAAPGPAWGARSHHQSGPRPNEQNQSRADFLNFIGFS